MSCDWLGRPSDEAELTQCPVIGQSAQAMAGLCYMAQVTVGDQLQDGHPQLIRKRQPLLADSAPWLQEVETTLLNKGCITDSIYSKEIITFKRKRRAVAKPS